MEASDLRVADLIRAGKMRVAFFLPLYVKDSRTGELRGMGPGIVDIEIAGALAAGLGVAPHLVGYSTPQEVVESLKCGASDMAFMGVVPSRAAEVAFTSPFMEMDYTCLVPAESSIGCISDADQPGVR